MRDLVTEWDFQQPYDLHAVEIINVNYTLFNTLRPRQNGGKFPDDIFNWIFLNENK